MTADARANHRIGSTPASPPPEKSQSAEAPKGSDSELPLLTAPRDGVPEVIDRIQPLLEWCERAESSPEEAIAVDAERASSYRYSARAYLIQLRTPTAGTALIDPTAFVLPGRFRDLLQSREWVLHAATQDLPCFAELGLTPPRLFDTELAARLLGMERVGLGAVVEDTVHLRLAKEHSAADWSQRPLPASWLAYAALDVEVLHEVKEVLTERLHATGKYEWALAEFEYARTHPLLATRSSSWRGLHSLGSLRTRPQLGAARSMWEHRDQLAQKADVSPHRVLRDRDLVAAAKYAERGRSAFEAALPRNLTHKDQWWKAARAGATLPPTHLPERKERSYPPSHRVWSKKWPQVWDRYSAVREAVAERAEGLQVPAENLLSPSVLRHWIWEHAEPAAESEVAQDLRDLGAREWQVDQVAPVLADPGSWEREPADSAEPVPADDSVPAGDSTSVTNDGRPGTPLLQ